MNSSKTTVYEKKADGLLFPLGQVVPNIDERVRKLENFPSAVLVTKPVIEGGLSLPEHGMGTITLTVSSTSLLPDSSITKFEYQLEDTELQSVNAVGGKASITLEAPETSKANDVLVLSVRAYDNYGSSNVNFANMTVVEVGVSTPTISGKTEDVIKGEASFTSSEFQMIGIEGTHDKSDWVLVKSISPDTEIWSSKDDTDNLTTCPADINDALESDGTYIIKVRYHDSITNSWSEYGELKFTTALIAVKTPTLSGKTEEVVKGSATYSGSAFELVGSTDSSHDKSDWVLVKEDAPYSEIWSSRNDSVNKTTSPQGFNEVLELGESYILKVRYHDSVNDVWSDYGTITFSVAVISVVTPVLSGDTENVVRGNVSFTSSEFQIVGALDGSHDKSDWILVTAEFPLSEIWSSKNDSVNKTTSPTTFNSVLELDKDYIIKVRYHDAVNDIWSDYGEIQFHTANITIATPTLSGNTTEVMKGSATFTGSVFQIIGTEQGTHDKSDWQLYKASATNSVIWESTNDSVNKTTSPQSLNDVLEVSTTYIIKVRYHDSVQNIWSDWGQLEFTTTDVFTYVEQPSITGETQNVQNYQIFMGSMFKIVGSLSGSNHDKSDWVLVKTDAPEVEIWSSKDDLVNKTSSPANLKSYLEVSTSYIIKLRYHDSVNDIWSDWGQLEFTTATEWDNLDAEPRGLHFIASRNVNNEDILTEYSVYISPTGEPFNRPENWASYLESGDFKFFINGVDKTSTVQYKTNVSKTNPQTLFTFKEGDEILITFTSYGFKFNKNITQFVKSVVGALPKVYTVYVQIGGYSNAVADNFGEFLANQTAITTVPYNLIDYTSTSGWAGQPTGLFKGCTGLQSIPVGFTFYGNETNKGFSTLKDTFYGCSSLRTVPTNIIKENTNLTNLENFFYNCSSLVPVVEITATNITSVENFATGCASKGTVYVPRDSTTAETFKTSLTANVNVIEV